MRILLLGSTGFAGRHFRRAAVAAGHEVISASRRSEDGEIEIDLLDADSVERGVRDTAPDAIVNLAGAASVSRSFREPLDAFLLNALGAMSVLEATSRARPDAQVLLISSGEIYGDPADSELPVTESQPPAPLSPYGSSKVAMEVVAAQYERAAGLRVAIARAFNHTGPGQSDAFAASSFARQVAEGEHDRREEVVLRVGNLSPVRDFSDVRDVVRAYLSLIEGGHTGTFNVCSGRPTPVSRIVELLGAASTIPVRVEVAEERRRRDEAAALYGSATRIERATGWRPELPLKATVADLLDAWRERMA